MSGQLPDGLTLNQSTGQITGVPTEVGIDTFTVEVTDSQNPSSSTTKQLSITVNEIAIIDEEFTTNTLEGYTVYIPEPGPEFTLSERPGYLRMKVPTAGIYDHWTNVDKAPQIRRGIIGEDWQVETKVELISVTGDAFHIGLMVYFSKFDIYYWGYYTSSDQLRLERSGENGIIDVFNVSSEVELRIRKEGEEYHFEYKEIGSVEWIEAGVEREETEEAIEIGIIGKTFGDNVSIVADFDYLRLREKLKITTEELPVGQIGSEYSGQLEVKGGEGPYNWSIASGQLPEGLILNELTGQISGIPTEVGIDTINPI